MAELNENSKDGFEQAPLKKSIEREWVNKLFLNEYRGDAVIVPINIISTEVNRVYRRHFDGVSRSLFYVRYYSRALNNTAIEQEIMAGVISLLDQAAERINQKNQLADSLIDQNKVKIKNGVAQTTISASVIDPLANRFLKLILAADEVARKYGALWMALAIDDKQKNQAMAETVNLLRQFHSNSTKISLGLRERVSSKTNSATLTGDTLKSDQSVIDDAAVNDADEFSGFETEEVM